MPVTGRYFYAASGRYFHAVLRRYFYAASGRPGRRCFPARFGAAKRQNGETAKRPRRCAARKQGARAAGRGDILMPFRGGIFMPVSRRYFHARFGAVFSCPFRGGIFMPFCGGIFMPFRGGIFMLLRGDIFMPLRGGETAKRPRRGAARKQGARAAGRGGMIFRATKIARKQGRGRPGRRCFPARFGAAKRQNGETAAPVFRPQARGAGGRERGHDFSRGEDRPREALFRPKKPKKVGKSRFICLTYLDGCGIVFRLCNRVEA